MLHSVSSTGLPQLRFKLRLRSNTAVPLHIPLEIRPFSPSSEL